MKLLYTILMFALIAVNVGMALVSDGPNTFQWVAAAFLFGLWLSAIIFMSIHR